MGKRKQTDNNQFVLDFYHDKFENEYSMNPKVDVLPGIKNEAIIDLTKKIKEKKQVEESRIYRSILDQIKHLRT